MLVFSVNNYLGKNIIQRVFFSEIVKYPSFMTQIIVNNSKIIEEQFNLAFKFLILLCFSRDLFQIQ